jgi:RNA polymerase sigma-70 factor (ECF subfamily)
VIGHCVSAPGFGEAGRQPNRRQTRLGNETRGHELEERDIRTFLERDSARLVAALTAIAGSRAAAEDAVQEAVARAWVQMEKGVRIESLTAWVATVSTRLVRSGVRRLVAERRARGRLGNDGGRGGELEAAETRLTVIPALRSLSLRQREALVLHYYLGLPVSDVARALRVSEGTVKAQLYRGRRALAQRLGVHDEEEGTHVAP